MNRYFRLALVLVVVAWPCVPALAYAYVDLDNRGKDLLEAPLNDFNFDVQHLIANASPRLKAAEGTEDPFERHIMISRNLRREYELARLSAEDAVKVARMRDSGSGHEAYAEGAGLEEDLRLYTAGAVAFGKYDFTAANAFFAKASSLRRGKPAYRVWSEYMLGRTEARLGHIDLAVQAYQAVRQLVIDGAPDPVGLGTGSYGAEARLLLTEAGGLLGEQDFTLGKRDRPKLLQRALELYVQQAATGSTSAAGSVHILCKEILRQSADTVLLNGSELARQVYLLYMLEYGGKYGGPEHPEEALKFLLSRFPAIMPGFAPQLADAAYRIGDLPLADAYARQSDNAMALWLRAKLMLTRSQRDQAWNLLQQATHMITVEGDHPSLSPDAIRALNHDTGQLAAARGDFEAALTAFRTAQDRDNAAYIAEQVMTAQELRNYVDGNVDEPKTIKAPIQWYRGYTGDDPQLDLHLRALLGRRLIRTGDTYDIAKYFTRYADAKCTIFDTDVSCNARLLRQFPTNQREVVEAYLGYRNTAAHAHGVKAADALYHMAIMERYLHRALFDHEIDISYDDSKPAVTDRYDPASFTSQDEVTRVAYSKGESEIDESPHNLAGQHLMQAADNLPPFSQAYAAVLCFGTDWNSDLVDHASRPFYDRYLAAGSPGAWTSHFGANCPEPDFAQASGSDPRHRTVYWLRHHRTAIFWSSSTGALLLFGLLAYRLSRR